MLDFYNQDDTKFKLINRLIDREGGYVNDPNDSGGETNFGITKEFARFMGYKGDMKLMPRQVAFDIYLTSKWSKIGGDEMLTISESLCEKVFDFAVHAGPLRSAKTLQRLLNVMNRSSKLYPDLKIDGRIGPRSIDAIKKYMKHRSEGILIDGFCCLQGAFYIGLAERRKKDEEFIYGWLKNRIKLY